MTEEQLLEQVSLKLSQFESIRKAEDYVSAQIEKNPGVADQLRKLLEQHRLVNQFFDAPTQPGIQNVRDNLFESPVPRNIGPYEIGALLGQGGFGQVYVAKQMEPVQRHVAIKLIRPEMSSPHVLSRFNMERQSLAVMNHPNIAKVFDGGTTDEGRPYFVMELVSGLPITKYASQNQLTVRNRLMLFLDVCHGIQHAHQKGVVHRDLKPSNIIVAADEGAPVVKVIDFGVAKAISRDRPDETMLTTVTQMIGTPRYMSPEQASLDKKDIDTRSDIYSLGVILYELLTGTTPIQSEKLKSVSFDELRGLICNEEPVKPSQRISKLNDSLGSNNSESSSKLSRMVRGDLDWIVMKSLEKDRERRYASATDLADDVQRYLNNEMVVARPPSKTYRVKKFVSKNRLLCAAVSSILISLSIATAFSAWHAVRATRAVEAEKTAKANEVEQRALAEMRAAEADVARANEEAKRRQAEEIRDTLVNIFKSTSPFADGSKVTVSSALENTVADIQNRFSDDPETRFLLLQAIGESQYGLGVYDKAIETFEIAIPLGESLPEFNHKYSGAKLQLAESLIQTDRFQEAEEIARAVVQESLEEFGPTDRITLRARVTHSECLHNIGRNGEALNLAINTCRSFEEYFDDLDEDRIRAETNLAVAYVDNYWVEKAIPILRNVVRKLQGKYGEKHVRTLSSKATLAGALARSNRMDRQEGRRLVESYLENVRGLMEESHPAILSRNPHWHAFFRRNGNMAWQLKRSRICWKLRLEKKEQNLASF